MIHQIDIAGDLLRLTVIFRIKTRYQKLLAVNTPRFTWFCRSIEHLGAPVGCTGKVILMDTDQKSVFSLFYELNTISEISLLTFL